MPLYEYQGLNRQGKNVRGTIDIENMRAARVKLKRDGIYVSSLKDKSKQGKKGLAKKQKGRQKVGVKDLAAMTRQLSTLLKANVPLVDSLGAVADQVENPTLSQAMSDIKNLVNEGTALHKALKHYPKIFNKIYVSMCEAGEMSGTLDVILLRLAEFTEAQTDLNSRVFSALMYPALMLGVSCLLMLGMFVFVIPKMMTVLESSDVPLPWYTQVVFGTSYFLIDYWLMIAIMMVIGGFVFHLWKNTPQGQVQWDRIVLKLPIAGKLIRVVAVSRFTRTLSTLLAGGVPMLSAMTIVRNVVNNEILARAIENARDNISEGESIAGPLKKSGEFPPIVIHMINIGEKTGELENMLTQVSDSYDHNVKVQIDGLTALMEPIMIVLLGGIIGVVVMSVMVPMMEMSNIGA